MNIKINSGPQTVKRQRFAADKKRRKKNPQINLCNQKTCKSDKLCSRCSGKTPKERDVHSFANAIACTKNFLVAGQTHWTHLSVLFVFGSIAGPLQVNQSPLHFCLTVYIKVCKYGDVATSEDAKLAKISRQTAKMQCNKRLNPFLKRFKNTCEMRRSKLLNVPPLTTLCLFFVRACFIHLSPLLFMT